MIGKTKYIWKKV